MIVMRVCQIKYIVYMFEFWFSVSSQILALPFNQPRTGANGQWCENGVTFADSTILGGSARGFFIDHNDTIYVAAHQKSRILVWLKGTIVPIQSSYVIYLNTHHSL